MVESGKVFWTHIIHSQEIPLPADRGKAITIGAGEKHEVKVNKTYLNPAHAPITLRANTSGELSISNPFEHPIIHDPEGQRLEIRPKMTKTLGKLENGATYKLLIGNVENGMHPLELQIRVEKS